MPILDPFEDVVQFHRPRGFESKIQVYRAGVQAIPNGVPTQVNFDTVVFDPLDEYDEAVGFTFSPVQSGYYYIHGSIGFPALPAGTIQTIDIRVTAASYSYGMAIHDGVAAFRCQASRLFYVTPTNTVWIRAYQNSGGPVNITANAQETFMEIFRVG